MCWTYFGSFLKVAVNDERENSRSNFAAIVFSLISNFQKRVKKKFFRSFLLFTSTVVNIWRFVAFLANAPIGSHITFLQFYMSFDSWRSYLQSLTLMLRFGDSKMPVACFSKVSTVEEWLEKMSCGKKKRKKEEYKWCRNNLIAIKAIKLIPTVMVGIASCGKF